MPAYHVKIQPTCYREGCPKKATVEVRNSFNSSMGFYCRTHGDRRVEELNKDE